MKRLSIDPVTAACLLWLIAVERSVWALLSLTAAVLHELGHLAAARALHVPLGGLTLSPVGARITLRDSLLSYRDEALIAAAGPAVNLVCAALAVHHHRARPDDRLLFFAAASLALALINLLPLPTFDGGRILACTAAGLLGPVAAARMSRLIGAAAAVCLWLIAAALALRTGGNLSLTVLACVLVWRAVTGNAGKRGQDRWENSDIDV